MDYIKLNNGVEMPALGYGVFLVPQEECERCVSDAISVGYRHIDTAQAYQNEEGVGAAVKKSGVKRDELFITTKVSYSYVPGVGDGRTMELIDESLKRLDMDYVDLLLLHMPYGDYYEAWRQLIKAREAGKARAIGISNFHPGRFYDFVAHFPDALPQVNQMQANVLMQQTGLTPLMDEFGVKMTCWGPLGGQGVDGIVTSPVLAKIGEQYGKTASQVALRWLTQKGYAAIPKSSHKERMAQNLDIFDFRLSDADMAEIAKMNQQDNGSYDHEDPQLIKWLLGYNG